MTLIGFLVIFELHVTIASLVWLAFHFQGVVHCKRFLSSQSCIGYAIGLDCWVVHSTNFIFIVFSFDVIFNQRKVICLGK